MTRPGVQGSPAQVDERPFAPLASQPVDLRRVASLRVELEGADVRSRVRLERSDGAPNARLDVELRRGDSRRTRTRYVLASRVRRAFEVAVRVSAGWRRQLVATSGVRPGCLVWRLELADGDGSVLRDCQGVGVIAQPDAFFAFLRMVEALAPGATDGLPGLAGLERAIFARDPIGYEPARDVVAGGAIAYEIGNDYLEEGLLCFAGARRDAALREARSWFLRAAEAGSAAAWAALGRLSAGLVGPADARRAARAYERAARGGSAEGAYLLADALVAGEGVRRDKVRARALYERAWALAVGEVDERVWAMAALRLAQALADGVGGDADLARAADLCVEAEAGLAEALRYGSRWLVDEYDAALALGELLAGE